MNTNAIMRCGMLFLSTIVIGCAAVTGSRGAHTRHAGGLTLVVINRDLEDLQLVLTQGSIAVPIGGVPAHVRRDFEMSPAQLGTGSGLQLTAGRRSEPARYRSVVFAATPGQRVEWVIERTSRFGFVMVR